MTLQDLSEGTFGLGGDRQGFAVVWFLVVAEDHFAQIHAAIADLVTIARHDRRDDCEHGIGRGPRLLGSCDPGLKCRGVLGPTPSR